DNNNDNNNNNNNNNNANLWVHVACAKVIGLFPHHLSLKVPNYRFDSAKPIVFDKFPIIPKKNADKLCHICSISNVGACVKCSAQKCMQWSHVMCALQAGGGEEGRNHFFKKAIAMYFFFLKNIANDSSHMSYLFLPIK
ncbi:hypothetical protein RFI_08971, partial [Reticulomyxa filosa]